MTQTYFTGWRLDAGDRAALLKRIPPAYPQVVAHHVTLSFGAPSAEPPPPAAGEVVGIADDRAGVQALVVRINGDARRPDGSTFHITWSLGPGRRAVESNAVLRDLGWGPLQDPVSIRLTPFAEVVAG